MENLAQQLHTFVLVTEYQLGKQDQQTDFLKNCNVGNKMVWLTGFVGESVEFRRLVSQWMEITRDGGRRVENFADPADKLAQSPSFGGKPFITAMMMVMNIHSGTPITKKK